MQCISLGEIAIHYMNIRHLPMIGAGHARHLRPVPDVKLAVVDRETLDDCGCRQGYTVRFIIRFDTSLL